MNYINARRRYLIAEDLIRTMKKGALIIDLRMRQGGCFETTCCLTPSDPEIFEQYGVLHYCKTDISNSVARTSSMAFSNILVSMLMALGDAGSFAGMIKDDNAFRSGVYMYAGKPVNSYISRHFNIHSNDLDIYLSAF
jgi:alanine dehydrogenase